MYTLLAGLFHYALFGKFDAALVRHGNEALCDTIFKTRFQWFPTFLPLNQR